jgi:FlaA1/EpsC-like NDP-sugar epimerase
MPTAERRQPKTRLDAALARLRRHRPALALAAYAGLVAASFGAAFLLRFEFRVPDVHRDAFFMTLPLLVGIRLLAFTGLRLTKGRWRYAGTVDMVRLLVAVLAGTAAFALVAPLLPLPAPVPRAVILLETLLTSYLIGGVWLAYRLGYEQLRRHAGQNGDAPRRVLIVGAGEAGNLLARELRRSATGYRLLGFIDDDPTKLGTTVQGTLVLGTHRQLPRIAEATAAEEILLAIPRASEGEVRRVVEACRDTGLPMKFLPGIAAVLAGEVRLDQLREVRIEDLLGREPVHLELPELAADLGGKCVLITGAAGSIGSELARQVALHKPGTLVLFDQAETDTFYLELELRDRHPELNLVPVIGDITHQATVERVFRQYTPDRVFHAAAYKHVPMMECNAAEAMRNNVIGTWRVADAAGRHGAGTFVLVSTDKAVRPVNVMGATKRLAEVAVLELQGTYPATRYGAVRFGNVLGSNGSVLPVFKKQLAEGKPLTVTHPDVTRFFMTIPEAVQLILQASLLPGLRGRIAMLEMGEPVRILDLARNLLRLSGARGRGNERITFSGLRPGEKLHEELSAPEERTVPTAIDKIRLLETTWDPRAPLEPRIRAWADRLDAATHEALEAQLAGWLRTGKLDSNGSASFLRSPIVPRQPV